MEYVIRQGDCFASIAARLGITVDNLLAIGDNNRCQSEGRSPHQLRPGDVIEIPDDPPNRSTDFSSGGRKTYKVRVPKVKFRMRLLDRAGEAHGNKRYELVVMHRTYTGQTDGDGWLEQQIPAVAMEGDLYIWLNDDDEQPWEMPLEFGALDPHTEDSGVAQRLRNLGHGIAFRGEEGLRQALVDFQRAEGLPVTGQLDDATRDHLDARRTQ